MTVVRHKFLRPSPAGDVPYSLELRFRPSRARVVDGDPKAVVVPAEFTEELPAGVLNVDLAPTGPGWCWEIFRPYGKVESLREWVVVPEPLPDPDNPGEFLPVDYPDLVRVDPDTLEPSAAPDPAWWAALEAAKATAVDVEVARVAAAASAAGAGSARDGAVAAAGEASGFAGDAAGSASVAVAAAGAAGLDAATATAQAVEAALALTGAESARDATVAAAGGSEASAALAAEAAFGAKQDAADAKAAAGTIIEMTETGRLSETALINTIGELSGPVIDAKVAPVMASAQDVVDRANAGEFDGADGAPGNATMRVDTTAGTRIFITDGVTEHMISGDTGWRAITLEPSPGHHLGGVIHIKRTGDVVSLYIPELQLEAGTTRADILTSALTPTGFKFVGGHFTMQNLGLINSATSQQVLSQYGALSWLYQITRNGVDATRPSTPLRGEFSWSTADPWPTTLPGIPT